jgi:hypothetical protein
MFFAPGLIFGGTAGIGSRFGVLCGRTRFFRYRGRRFPFSCFALPDTFSGVPRASGPVFKFCAPILVSTVSTATRPVFMFCSAGLFFGDTEGVGSRFHVLRTQICFLWYQGRRVPCFALPDSFSTVQRALGPIFIFCAPGLIFGGTDGVRSCFRVLRSRACFRRCRVGRVLFSCFVHSDSFSAISRATGPVFMFCNPGRVFGRTEGVESRFHVYALGHFFGGTKGVGSRFHVLSSRTRFRRKRGCHLPFSCFALPESFPMVSRASCPVFMFCAPGHVFGGTEGVRSRFHVLRSRTCFLVLRARVVSFRRSQGRQVPFSYFAFPDSFSAVPTASGPVFMFCAPGHVFGGAEYVVSRFHILQSRTSFWRYKGRRVPFSCFAFPDTFSAETRVPGAVFLFCAPESFPEVPRASCPIFKFFAPRLIFGRTEGDGSHFHILHARTHFWWYRGRLLTFSCFARPDSFSAVLRASDPVFLLYAPDHVFGGTEGVRSGFHVLRAWTHFRRKRGCEVPFSCFALPESFSAVPRTPIPFFHSLTHFRRYCGHQVPFSCFPLLDSFSAEPRTSGPVFIFCAARLFFGGTEGVGSHFHFLRARTHFRRYRGRQVPFSCFPLSDSFSAVPRASGPVFMFCATRLVFGGTEGVGLVFIFCAPGHDLRRKRGCRTSFSCFALPESFPTVPRASCPVFKFCAPGLVFNGIAGVGLRFHVFSTPELVFGVNEVVGSRFMFCAPGLVFGGTEGVSSRFYVLRARIDFRRYRGRPIPFSCFLHPDMFSAIPRTSGPILMFCPPGLVFS